jgi:hypothetical protein
MTLFAGHPQAMLTELYIEVLLLMRSWLIRFGRLGIGGLRSELSVPWNRE